MRVSKPPAERRAELVAAARVLFDEKGVDKTRVSDIVGRVGVAQGVFYYYFTSKEEMVKVVVAQVGQETRHTAGAILADTETPFCHKLAMFIEMMLDLVDKFMGDDETRLPRQAVDNTLAAASFEELGQSLRTLIMQGAASGDIAAAHPWETARVLLYGFRQLAEEALPGRKVIYTVTERALGLPEGDLVRYLPAG